MVAGLARRSALPAALALVLGCASHRRSEDAAVPRDPDAGTDAGRPTRCSDPESLPARSTRLATGDAPSPCAGDDVTFVTVTIPPFSQMVPLDGAELPVVIGDCGCEVPYHESTAGYGEPLTLVATARAGATVGYEIEPLEPNAACPYALEVPLGAATEPRRLDRAGARIAICDDDALRPLYFVIEDPAATMLHVQTDARATDLAPFVVGVFLDGCEGRDRCGTSLRSPDGAPLALPIPPGPVRYAMVALLAPRREVSVTLRAE